MVVLNVVMITGGQVVADLRGGWRWMVGLGAGPAGLQCICLIFLPESREYHNNKSRCDCLIGWDSAHSNQVEQPTSCSCYYIKNLRICDPRGNRPQGTAHGALWFTYRG